MPEKPAQERPLPPTFRRLQKAKQKGQVAQSKELPSAFTLLMFLLMLCVLGPNLLQWFTTQLKQGLTCQYELMSDNHAFLGFISETVISSILVIAPFLLALMVGSIAGCVAISGWNYSAQTLKLRLDVINPVSGLKNLISVRSFVTFILSILKLILIISIVYIYLRNRLDDLAALRWAWSMQILAEMAKLIVGVVARILVAVLVLAVAEAIYQKWKWKYDLRMTRQEVKEERKQEEGAPEVKRRVRKAQFEMARRRMLKEIPKASVVLVNPTHVAVALRYNRGPLPNPENKKSRKTTEAPVVVAKGADFLCEKIREIARAYGVPIIRRPELARTLYSTVEVGQQIPQSLFVAVAEVLAMIYRLKRRR